VWLHVTQVETINDQYMVAGGLPERSDDHAIEICLMALELLGAVADLSVPQMPDHELRLRIGIHTGAASVLSYLPRSLHHSHGFIQASLEELPRRIIWPGLAALIKNIAIGSDIWRCNQSNVI